MLNICLEIITTGLPFCAFKIVTGLYFNQYWLTIIGVIDLFINVSNLFSILVLKKRLFDTCFLSFIVRTIKKPNLEAKLLWQDLGNSLDVLISFSLVALMIGGGFIAKIPPDQLCIWNLSVILNVFGAGYGRLTASIHNLKN
jgi:hypothetical protein